MVEHRDDLTKYFFHRLTGCLAFLSGESQRAWHHLEISLHRAMNNGGLFLEALNRLAAAQVFHMRGEDQEAEQHLAQAFRIGDQMGSDLLKCVGYLIGAELALDRGDETRGLVALQAGLTIARTSGSYYGPWWQHSVGARLCIKALEAGIETEFVRHLIGVRRLTPEIPPVCVESWPWTVKVSTLGTLRILVEDRPVHSGRKAPRRPMALLKALITLGGQEIAESRLSDALWPEAESDLAHQAFTTTLHRLRKLIGHEEVLQVKEGKLTLDPYACWVDAWAYEQLVNEAQRFDLAGQRERAVEVYERARRLYTGPFLAEDIDDAWMLALRDRLRGKYIECITRLVYEHEHDGRLAQGLAYLQDAVRLEPCVEVFYQLLMTRLHDEGHQAEALHVYEQCRRALAAIQQRAPSIETDSIRARLYCPNRQPIRLSP